MEPKKKINLTEATIQALSNTLYDNSKLEKDDVEGIIDGVLVVTDPEINSEDYEEVIENAQQIVEDTPEGEIPFTEEYLGEYLQQCPICGQQFIWETILEPGATCPLCLEQPEAFIMIGKVESTEEVAEDNDIENNADGNANDSTEKELEDEKTELEKDLASKQLDGNKLEETKLEEAISGYVAVYFDDKGYNPAGSEETFYTYLSNINKAREKAMNKPIDPEYKNFILLDYPKYESMTGENWEKMGDYIKDAMEKGNFYTISDKIEESNNDKEQKILDFMASYMKQANLTELTSDERDALRSLAIASLNLEKDKKDEDKSELISQDDDPKFNYMLLDRMKQDCKYFLGNGNKNDKYLWAGNVDDQIAKMKELWNSFPEDEKPEWLSMEDIENFEIEMKSDKEIKEENMLDDLASEISINQAVYLIQKMKELGWDGEEETIDEYVKKALDKSSDKEQEKESIIEVKDPEEVEDGDIWEEYIDCSQK